MHKLILPAILGVAFFAPAARADLMSSLGGGTVTVSSIDANDVEVTVTLASGNVFAITGDGDDQVFLFNVDKSVTLVGTITSPFGPLGGSFTLNGSGKGGTYSNGIGCVSSPTVKCTGTSDLLTGPISFELKNSGGLTVTDFTKSSGGDFFAEDIGVPDGKGGFSTGVTTSDTVTITSTPEPASIVLLVGVLALILIPLRKRLLA
jgi:hypothetical protein